MLSLNYTLQHKGGGITYILYSKLVIVIIVLLCVSQTVVAKLQANHFKGEQSLIVKAYS